MARFVPPVSVPDGYKYCSKGEECIHPEGPILPATTEYFYIHSGNKKLCARCKKCYDARVKKWRSENPDVVRESYRQWTAKHPGYSAKYYKGWRIKNPERARAKWATAHRARRARKFSAEGIYTQEDIDLQYNSQHGRCWWCGKKLNGKYEADHRIPLSRGGSNGAGNICITCGSCNAKKHNKMPWEWIGRLL